MTEETCGGFYPGASKGFLYSIATETPVITLLDNPRICIIRARVSITKMPISYQLTSAQVASLFSVFLTKESYLLSKN